MTKTSAAAHGLLLVLALEFVTGRGSADPPPTNSAGSGGTGGVSNQPSDSRPAAIECGALVASLNACITRLGAGAQPRIDQYAEAWTSKQACEKDLNDARTVNDGLRERVGALEACQRERDGLRGGQSAIEARIGTSEKCAGELNEAHAHLEHLETRNRNLERENETLIKDTPANHQQERDKHTVEMTQLEGRKREADEALAAVKHNLTDANAKHETLLAENGRIKAENEKARSIALSIALLVVVMGVGIAGAFVLISADKSQEGCEGPEGQVDPKKIDTFLQSDFLTGQLQIKRLALYDRWAERLRPIFIFSVVITVVAVTISATITAL